MPISGSQDDESFSKAKSFIEEHGEEHLKGNPFRDDVNQDIAEQVSEGMVVEWDDEDYEVTGFKLLGGRTSSSHVVELESVDNEIGHETMHTSTFVNRIERGEVVVEYWS